MSHDLLLVLGKLAAAFHLLGIASAVPAIMRARTSQGAIAWAISLISFPYISLPLFWIFGRDRFNGYTVGRREKDSEINHIRGQILAKAGGATYPTLPLDPAFATVLEALAHMRFTPGNRAKLLVDGTATFNSIFEGIDSAREYLLVQFFIVKDDELGRAFRDRLLAASRRGVKIYFLFDEVGSHRLPKKYLQSLREAGVDIRAFKTTKGAKNRFQINFRNHRKIVIVDGKVAFVGGHNVGDEYMGRDAKFGEWRDTHVRIEGPATLQVQASFAEDWHWSAGSIPPLHWNFEPVPGGMPVLVLPTGPADVLDTCCLMFLQAIQSAKKRIWITSPYFVPDAQIISALQLAALRGVDVRIILPSMSDHLAVWLSSFSYLKDTLPYNVHLYRFQNGFLHEKVMLVDDNLSAIGTANFDNRSFRLNFEITTLFADQEFSKQVEKMLQDDLAHSKAVTMAEITDRPWHFKLAVQICRLMAPIL